MELREVAVRPDGYVHQKFMSNAASVTSEGSCLKYIARSTTLTADSRGDAETEKSGLPPELRRVKHERPLSAQHRVSHSPASEPFTVLLERPRSDGNRSVHTDWLAQ